jgi:hypothetical protein
MVRMGGSSAGWRAADSTAGRCARPSPHICMGTSYGFCLLGGAAYPLPSQRMTVPQREGEDDPLPRAGRRGRRNPPQGNAWGAPVPIGSPLSQSPTPTSFRVSLLPCVAGLETPLHRPSTTPPSLEPPGHPPVSLGSAVQATDADVAWLCGKQALWCAAAAPPYNSRFSPPAQLCGAKPCHSTSVFLTRKSWQGGWLRCPRTQGFHLREGRCRGWACTS